MIEGVTAGSTVSGLELMLLDATGNTVPAGTSGKLRAPWLRRPRELRLDATGRTALGSWEVRCIGTALESTYRTQKTSASKCEDSSFCAVVKRVQAVNLASWKHHVLGVLHRGAVSM